MKIRPFQPNDHVVFNIPPFPANVTAWVIADETPIGYVAYGMLPGLPDQADLYIYVRPAYRRQKLGSQLFKHVTNILKHSSIRQLSSPSENENSSLSHFLRAHGCYVSHKEVQLTRPTLNALPAPTVWLTKLDLNEGAYLLQQLYSQSFADFRWYQPYESVDEILEEYSAESDLLFLYKNERPIGFAGILYQGDAADIEPLGIIKAYQGQGFGRKLLVATLHHLSEKSVRKAHITTWNDNRLALSLYRSLGFQLSGQRTYLAYDIDSAPSA